MKKYIFIFLLIFFAFTLNPRAEDDSNINNGECTSDLKNQLATEALKVTSSYEFATNTDGSTYFVISIYNITKNLYVSYTDKDGNSNYILYSDTKDGVYSFNDYNIETIFKYSFEIWGGLNNNCSYKILTNRLTKPKRNSFADMDECQYEKMKDYYYCKEWITNNFYIDDDTIKKNIKNKLNETSTTSKVVNGVDETNYITFLDIYIKIRIYLIIGLIIGIIIDICCIYFSIRKVRESTL